VPEAVVITLEDGSRFGEWSELEFQFGLDSYSGLTLSGPFDHERQEVRRAFQPLMFPTVTVNIGDELVLTGRVKDISPSVDAGAASIGVCIYALAHDLTQLCAAPDAVPLEFNGLDLRQIDARLVTPTIGLAGFFDDTPGAKFARVKCEPDGIIHNFIVDLALQRGFVLSNLVDGGLLYRSEGPTGRPVARLEGQPLGKVTAAFEPANWFSKITGRACKKAGKGGSRYSQDNLLFRGSTPRFFTLIVGDTEAADVPRAVKSAIGRMTASVVTYTVDDLPGWRDPQGDLWIPDRTVTLLAPEAMIYRETELMIRSVKFRQTAESETTSLGLCLPGTFGGKLPKELPWDL
jgi:prophage tail gpP-like protein